MEDGFPLFDPNNEAERQEQKLREYYEDFSTNARNRLLAKTIVRPTTVYDILYPKTRETLLAKNIPFKINLEKDAELIRNKLIAKLITSETDLEKISADFRNSLLARAKIVEDKEKLINDGLVFRNNLISKNVPKESNLETDSEEIRRNNISKNKPDPSAQKEADRRNASFRGKAISKNNTKEQDLLADSEELRNNYRKNDTHKNVSNKSDLEKDTNLFRKNNLSKNVPKDSDLENESKAFRNDNLRKSVEGTNSADAEQIGEEKRRESIAKNVPNERDLKEDSEQFRTDDLSKNAPVDSDIEKISESFRKNNISVNKPSPSDLESDSEQYRNDDLAVNKSVPRDLEEDSIQYRNDDLAANKPSPSNLETDSTPFRDDDLSANKPSPSDLEKDSAQFRDDDLSANKPNSNNLESDSEQFRADELSANKPSPSDLEADSIQFRADDLSSNKSNESDLESDSVQRRADSLSVNKPSGSDLEKDSTPFRDNDLSANKLSPSDLEADSTPFRDDDLSANKPNPNDLESDSVLFRDDDLASNTPNVTDLEGDSVQFRDDDLAANTPNITNLEDDSVQFRNDDLSENTPNITNLVVDSTPFLFNNLSPNVPNGSDLLTDSAQFLNDDLSANVPNGSNLIIDSAPFLNNNLSPNVPSSSDLATDSGPFRANDLAHNVPKFTNLVADSIDFRDDSLASNVPLKQNLLTDSITYRHDAVAKNAGYGLLGVNVQGAGTSAFLGISRVFTQGIILRQLLFSKNKPKNIDIERDNIAFRANNLARQQWVPQASQAGASLEYGSSSEHFDLLSSSRETTGRLTKIAGYDQTGSPSKKAIEKQSIWFRKYNFELQSLYGNTALRPDGSTPTAPITFNDKAFYTDTTNPQGGGFDSPKNTADGVNNFSEGYVTENIRLYNIERNSFNIKKVQVGGLDGFGNLSSFDGDGSFQGLIASTVGSLNVRQSIATQAGTNTTPIGVVIANEGKYFKGDSDIMKPGAEDAPLGTAASMMGKTAIGNPFEDEDFFVGRRGVRHIVNTIKTSDEKLAPNFDPQNNRAYIAGTNRDGSAKISRQRYTIANPYAPQGAGKLLFFIKNYSSNEQFFFPPYIDSMQNTESASWNETNFLGRPEATYTYNNSTRSASLSFFVLTDYAQKVDIGRDWGSETMDKITVGIDAHFTDSDVSQNSGRKLEVEKLRKLKDDQNKQLAKINEKIEENSAEKTRIDEASAPVEVADGETTAETSEKVQTEKDKEKKNDKLLAFEKKNNDKDTSFFNELKDTVKTQAANTIKAIGNADLLFNKETNYYESNSTAGNVYNINIIKKEFNNGEIICKPEDSEVRINTMKEGLMFQPAFFSGDKVDFIRKVEFLAN